MRQARISLSHRFFQRIDNLALDRIGKVPAVGNIGIAAPAIGDFLVLGHHIGDVSKELFVGGKRLGQRAERGGTLFFLLVAQQIKRLFQPQRFAIDLEFERRHRLIEQPVPCGVAGRIFVVEQLFDTIFELVGPRLAQLVKPRTVVCQVGARFERGVEHTVFDPVDFELKEQCPRRKPGQPVLRIAQKLHPVAIAGVLRIVEVGERTEPPEHFAQFFIPPDRLDQFAGFGQPVELALEIGLKGFGFRIEKRQIGLEGLGLHVGIQVAQVPFG